MDCNIPVASVSDETLEKLLLEKDTLNKRRATYVSIRVFRAYLNEKQVGY